MERKPKYNNHPLATNKQRLKMTKREIVYDKFNGRCAYCGCELKAGFHIDHIDPIRRNSDGSCLNPQNKSLSNIPEVPHEILRTGGAWLYPFAFDHDSNNLHLVKTSSLFMGSLEYQDISNDMVSSPPVYIIKGLFLPIDFTVAQEDSGFTLSS